jgi:pyruvate kinase
MRRQRNAKIVATLGPSSSTPEAIKKLFLAGVDVFRLNFSHGSHADHRVRWETIRAIEREAGHPIAILMDLQGPKLRVGTFERGPVQLKVGAPFRFDLDAKAGDERRVQLPHREIFAALKPGVDLLVDDGKVRMKVQRCGADFAETVVEVAAPISDRKGVNVPGVVLPLSPLTEKDRTDLAFGLELGVDWVALSFVQRPEDIDEARLLVRGRAAVLAKLEKPAAIEHVEQIVARSDGIMVARGDLGVEMPPEKVPVVQRQIVRLCRREGKPVIVATQMLESMISSPVPTRAEASDVATAIYDGADAVMLSAESASGQYPLEAVTMMNRVIAEVEGDPYYRELLDASHKPPQPTVADAICSGMRSVARLLDVAATVTFTSSGSTALRASRERPEAPILSLTPNLDTARRLALAWGVSAVHAPELASEQAMVPLACETAKREGFAKAGDWIVIIAGLPLGTAGTTNNLRVAQVA